MIKRSLLIWPVIILLAGCSSSSYFQKANNVEQWRATVVELEQIKSWDLQGKISIRTGDDLFTADLFWKQQGQYLDLQLSAPFGQGTTLFRGNDEKGYQVQTDQGQLINIDSPEAVAANAFGVDLPFTELKSWVRGLPDKDKAIWQVRFNAENRLSYFEQSGWQVSILRYKKNGNTTLPAKLFLRQIPEDLTQQQVDVRLVLRRWVL